jgi:hypothetical protein
LFVAPFLVAYVVWAGRRDLRARLWLLPAAAGLGLLGLSVYLYLPLAALRNPPLAYNHPTTLDAVLWLVTGQQFRYQFGLFSANGPAELIASLPALADIAVRRATPVLPLLGLAGLPVLVVRRPAFGLTCVAILLTGIFVWATYLQLEHYLLVPWVIVAIGAGVALDAIANGLARIWRRLVPPRGRSLEAGAIVGAAALGFAAVLAGLNWAASDRSGDHAGDEYVAQVFEALPPGAAVVSYWDPTMPLWYGQFVEGMRPDVLVVDDSNIAYDGLGSSVQDIESLICERPVFVMRVNEVDLAPILARYRLAPFLTVRSSALGPTAVLDQAMFRVERPTSGCPGG